jgi:hypothetical protein
VKLIVIGPGREAEAKYGGVRRAPVMAPVVSCVTQPMAQGADQHGYARHG